MYFYILISFHVYQSFSFCSIRITNVNFNLEQGRNKQISIVSKCSRSDVRQIIKVSSIATSTSIMQKAV